MSYLCTYLLINLLYILDLYTVFHTIKLPQGTVTQQSFVAFLQATIYLYVSEQKTHPALKRWQWQLQMWIFFSGSGEELHLAHCLPTACRRPSDGLEITLQMRCYVQAALPQYIKSKVLRSSQSSRRHKVTLFPQNGRWKLLMHCVDASCGWVRRETKQDGPQSENPSVSVIQVMFVDKFAIWCLFRRTSRFSKSFIPSANGLFLNSYCSCCNEFLSLVTFVIFYWLIFTCFLSYLADWCPSLTSLCFVFTDLHST